MIGLGAFCEVLVYSQPTDLRKGHNGLAAIVRKGLCRAPDSGDLFVFFNRRRNSVKVLTVHNDHPVVVHKKLRSGTFQNIFDLGHHGTLTLTEAQLYLLIQPAKISP